MTSSNTPATRPDQMTWPRRPGYEDVIYEMAMNADCAGQAGTMAVAGSATLLYYTTDEGREGQEAYLEKRKPDFSRFKRYP